MDSVISFFYSNENPEMKLISYKDIANVSALEAFVEEVTGQDR